MSYHDDMAHRFWERADHAIDTRTRRALADEARRHDHDADSEEASLCASRVNLPGHEWPGLPL